MQRNVHPLTTISQYFAEVNVPFLNITLAELGIMADYFAFLLWCLLDESESIGLYKDEPSSLPLS